MEVKIKIEYINKSIYYYFLGNLLLFGEKGYCSATLGDESLEHKVNTCFSGVVVNRKDRSCLADLPSFDEVGRDDGVRALIKSYETKGLNFEKGMESAFTVAKHYISQGSIEAFQYYMLYHTIKNLDIFTQENLKLIEDYALRGSECARGYFVEAYGFGGRGRIEIDAQEQQRTQILVEQFAEEGFRGAKENLQYLKLAQMLESSTKAD